MEIKVNERRQSPRRSLPDKPPNAMFPRVGAFEVWVGGVAVFSKLESGRWPNPKATALKVEEIVNGRETIESERQLNTQSSKLTLTADIPHSSGLHTHRSEVLIRKPHHSKKRKHLKKQSASRERRHKPSFPDNGEMERITSLADTVQKPEPQTDTDVTVTDVIKVTIPLNHESEHPLPRDNMTSISKLVTLRSSDPSLLLVPKTAFSLAPQSTADLPLMFLPSSREETRKCLLFVYENEKLEDCIQFVVSYREKGAEKKAKNDVEQYQFYLPLGETVRKV